MANSKTRDRKRPSDRRWRNLGIGAAVLAGGAALLGIFARRGMWAAELAEGHAAPDLAEDAPSTHGPDAPRAAEDFRPDPTAVPTDAEREALRPASATSWH